MNNRGAVGLIVLGVVMLFAVAAMVQGRLTGHYAETHKAIGVLK